MTIYNKLVRDKISEILKNKNLNPIMHTANETEYWEKLKEKLQEEVNEFLENSNKGELADPKNRKAREMGKFNNKTILEEV